MTRSAATLLGTTLLAFALCSSSFSNATVDTDLGPKFGKSMDQLETTTSALGTLFKPKEISAKIITDPGYKVSVTYSTECFRRSKTNTRTRDGAFDVVGPSVVRIPVIDKQASKCYVSVGAVLYEVEQGPIRVQLFGKQRKTG